jgi:hypothetical protein
MPQEISHCRRRRSETPQRRRDAVSGVEEKRFIFGDEVLCFSQGGQELCSKM